MFGERVLCAVDFSEVSVRALRYASAVSRWYGIELHVLHVAVPLAHVGMPLTSVLPLVALQTPEEMAASLAQFIAASGVDAPVAQVVIDGPAVASILAQSVALQVGLLVIGTHGRTGLEHALLGSTAERVIQRAFCPVLTVPTDADVPGGPGDARFSHIVCASDFSAASRRATDMAISLASENRAALTLLHVLEALSEEETLAAAHFRVGEYVQLRRDEVTAQLEALVPDAVRDRCEVRVAVGVGTAGRVVLQKSEDLGADLIVLGTHGHTAVGQILFGSTSQTVVQRARCPVLTVRV